jgi:hypothetical protein
MRPFPRRERLLFSNISMSEDADSNHPEVTLRSVAEAEDREGPLVPSDSRVDGVWRSWLARLATDAEAALGAALAYESLPADARDAWLDALEADVRHLEVPSLALYAPLLSVEADASRRARMESAVASAPATAAVETVTARALRGVAPGGIHACIVAVPLYLAFVQVLWCRYRPGAGMLSVRHDPIRHVRDVADLGEVDGIVVGPAPLHLVVEELAHAILADQREKRPPSAALASFAHLFDATLITVEYVAAR